jgi:hydrogenase nickel incorporation protein HypB
MERYLHHLDAVHPGVATMQVSARTGEGVEEFRSWLERVPVRAPA